MSKAVIGVLIGVAMLASACSDLDSTSATPSTASTPQYQHFGPHRVSVTTLDLGSAGPILGERLATVYYPTNSQQSRDICEKTFSYTESQTLPAALQSVLPEKYNTTQVVPDTRLGCNGEGLPAESGHFPIVLFSHGFGGERLYYSNLLTGIASWGYVVVSADYLERGLASQALKGVPKSSPALDRSIMLSSLDAVTTASSSKTSVLSGSVNAHLVAALGHSAGGRTAFDALNSPRISTAIGWAPVAPSGAPAKKPTMIIGATKDTAVPRATVTSTYKSFPAPKSLIEIGGFGHNTYTDICVGIRQGGGLINFAVANHFTTPQLAALGINGCQMSDLSPTRFWPVVQYYTVFQLKTALAGRSSSVAVPEPATGTFPGVTVAVTQER